MIRPANHEDAEAIARIYNHYIENTIITFEEALITAEEIVSRMENFGPDLPRFVDEEAGEVKGYAYASEWSGRCAYRHTAECSVYLDKDAVGRGIGTALYGRLLDDLENKGFHIVIGGVALPNPASVALHERLGFEKVAHFKEVGWKFGQWIDVGYWQRTL